MMTKHRKYLAALAIFALGTVIPPATTKACVSCVLWEGLVFCTGDGVKEQCDYKRDSRTGIERCIAYGDCTQIRPV